MPFHGIQPPDRCRPTGRLLAWLTAVCLALPAQAGLFGNALSADDVVPMPANADQVRPRDLQTSCLRTNMSEAEWRLCHQVIAARLPAPDPAHPEWFGAEYSPTAYWRCRRDQSANHRGIADCDVHRLRRNPHPEYWPYPDVPPVKWPAAPADSVWRPFMSSKDYLKALCESEAGWFIYRTVEDVEGIYIVRPRGMEDDDDHMMDPRVVEDAWGIAFYGWRGPTDFVPDNFIQPPYGRYRFIETKRKFPVQPEQQDHYAPRIDGPAYYRFFRNPDRKPSVTVFDWSRPTPYLVDRNEISSPSARYGFTWREIDRPHLADKHLVGGELIVLDLQTNEVLGVRRAFMSQGKGLSCPNLIDKLDKTFIYSVLKPKPNQAD